MSHDKGKSVSSIACGNEQRFIHNDKKDPCIFIVKLKIDILKMPNNKRS